MVRNFALTFAAVTLRLRLPAQTAVSGSFLEAYRRLGPKPFKEALYVAAAA